MPASGPGYPGAGPGHLRSFRGGLTPNDVWHEVEVKRIRRPPRGDHRLVLLLSLSISSLNSISSLPAGPRNSGGGGVGGGPNAHSCSFAAQPSPCVTVRFGGPQSAWDKPARCVGQGPDTSAVWPAPAGQRERGWSERALLLAQPSPDVAVRFGCPQDAWDKPARCVGQADMGAKY